MEILGNIYDVTIPKGHQGKIKIRTVGEDNIIVDKVEAIIGEDGKITMQ